MRTGDRTPGTTVHSSVICRYHENVCQYLGNALICPSVFVAAETCYSGRLQRKLSVYLVVAYQRTSSLTSLFPLSAVTSQYLLDRTHGNQERGTWMVGNIRIVLKHYVLVMWIRVSWCNTGSSDGIEASLDRFMFRTLSRGKCD
jgi:hypothetical protein